MRLGVVCLPPSNISALPSLIDGQYLLLLIESKCTSHAPHSIPPIFICSIAWIDLVSVEEVFGSRARRGAARQRPGGGVGQVEADVPEGGRLSWRCDLMLRMEVEVGHSPVGQGEGDLLACASRLRPRTIFDIVARVGVECRKTLGEWKRGGLGAPGKENRHGVDEIL